MTYPPHSARATIEAGLRWLIETVQPDGAVIQHHGDGTHAGPRYYRFVPDGNSCVVVMCMANDAKEYDGRYNLLNPLTQADVDQLIAGIVREGIGQRIGYGPAGDAILDVYAGETPGTVIVRVNSGGNYLAAEQALIGHGFTVMPGPKPTYGCTLVVTHG